MEGAFACEGGVTSFPLSLPLTDSNQGQQREAQAGVGSAGLRVPSLRRPPCFAPLERFCRASVRGPRAAGLGYYTQLLGPASERPWESASLTSPRQAWLQCAGPLLT